MGEQQVTFAGKSGVDGANPLWPFAKGARHFVPFANAGVARVLHLRRVFASQPVLWIESIFTVLPV